MRISMKKTSLVIILSFLLSVAVSGQKKFDFEARLQPALFSISMVMMHDVVNPPAASRYYAYCMMGAYDFACDHNKSMIPLTRLLPSGGPRPPKDFPTDADWRISSIYCIYETARQMLPSGFMLQKKQDEYIESLRKARFPQKIIDRSLDIAVKEAALVMRYAAADRYSKLSAKLRYTPVKGDGAWYPTPPAYFEAVEPNWRTIRTMLIDSCNQFPPSPPTVFSKDTSSLCYHLAKEVYDVSHSENQDQADQAMFWDCNPFAVATSGHMSLGFKKISPGGHWMNITCIAAQKAKLDLDKYITVLTMEAFTQMDAFISCWDEKYRSNRIRPETYINRYIDPQWKPLLQTPPFPEYASGHSVVSAASAEVLSFLISDNFAYTDDTEIMFQLAPRNFSSFRQASDEAAISRLYGGIHFRDAIAQGQAEGKQVGEFIVKKLKEAGVRPVLQENSK